MGYDRNTKKELIDIINKLLMERADMLNRSSSDTAGKVALRRIKTLEFLYNKVQVQFVASTEIIENTKLLLDEERKDSQVLLKIQEQLITLLGGKVWICPSCGKVASGDGGPHLVMCADCVS